jgi:alkaline phosphatase D
MVAALVAKRYRTIANMPTPTCLTSVVADQQDTPATPCARSRDSWTRRDWLGGSAALLAAPGLLGGCAPAIVSQIGRAEEPRFELGIASGSPRTDRVVLWTRLTGPALPTQVEVRWEMAHDEAFQRIVAQGSELADADWAHSVHAEPVGLTPGRWYWYRFSAFGQYSARGRTRTLPAPDSLAPLHLVQASCQRWDHGHYAAWRHAAAESPDLIVFLGDYIYESAPATGRVRLHEGSGACRTLAQYRARYAQYKSDPALRAAHASAPWIVTWDDHEVANDYAGLHSAQPDPDFTARRAAAYRAYWEHMPLPKSNQPNGAEMLLYQHYDWGRLARLITLDERQYRDPQACPKTSGGSTTVRIQDCPALLDPSRSVLGAAQERWLAESWRSDTRWNLLAQQTLMSRFAWRNPTSADATVWNDGWDGYAPARQRLLSDMLARQAAGPVVLSGDVHATYVADLKLDFDDPAAATIATEFCGTSISSEGLAQERLNAALPYNSHLRYGRSDERGYLSLRMNARQMQMQVRNVLDAKNPDSDIRTTATFMVEQSQPGARRL